MKRKSTVRPRCKINQSGAAERLNLSNVDAEEAADHINAMLVEGKVCNMDSKQATYSDVANLISQPSVVGLCEVTAALNVQVKSFTDCFGWCKEQVELASNELESATQKLNAATSNLDELAHKVYVFSSQLTDMDRDGALQEAISDLKKQTGVGSAPSMAVGAHASSASGANNEEAGGVPGSSAGGANKEEVQVVEDLRDNNNRVNIVPMGDGRGSGHQLDTDESDIVAAGDEQRILVKESGTAPCPDGKQNEMAEPDVSAKADRPSISTGEQDQPHAQGGEKKGSDEVVPSHDGRADG